MGGVALGLEVMMLVAFALAAFSADYQELPAGWTGVVACPDGRMLVYEDHEPRVWPVDGSPEPVRTPAGADAIVELSACTDAGIVAKVQTDGVFAFVLIRDDGGSEPLPDLAAWAASGAVYDASPGGVLVGVGEVDGVAWSVPVAWDGAFRVLDTELDGAPMHATEVLATNDDGSVQVGDTYVDATQQTRAIVWDADGAHALPQLGAGGSSEALAVSPDGRVIVGAAVDSSLDALARPVRWVDRGAPEVLFDRPGSALDVDADGQIVTEGGLWSGSELVPANELARQAGATVPEGHTLSPRRVSADGRTIFGLATLQDTGDGGEDVRVFRVLLDADDDPALVDLGGHGCASAGEATSALGGLAIAIAAISARRAAPMASPGAKSA